MDPNEALRLIRSYIKQMREEDKTPIQESADLFAFVQHARDLMETFEGLDEWLRKDGFLPADWLAEEDKNPVHCGCGQPIVWIEDDPENWVGHWEHNVAEAYWGGDHSIDEPAPEGWN